MVKEKKKNISVLGLSVLLLFLLTAFGCRTDEGGDANENVNAEPDTRVTFTIPEDGTGDTANTTASDIAASDQQDTNGNVNAEVIEDPSIQEQPDQTTDSEQEEIIALAEKIVEIFGSYTNKSNEPFKNVTDIEIYATDRLQPFLDSLKQGTVDENALFYGVTTKALSTAVISSTANSAELLITTEREEVTETAQTGVSTYVLIKVDMIKDGDEWKVNGLYWQE